MYDLIGLVNEQRGGAKRFDLKFWFKNSNLNNEKFADG